MISQRRWIATPWSFAKSKQRVRTRNHTPHNPQTGRATAQDESLCVSEGSFDKDDGAFAGTGSSPALQLRRAAPRGVKAAGGVGVRVVVLLDRPGAGGAHDTRRRWSSVNRLRRTVQLPVEQRRAGLTRRVLFAWGTKVLRPSASSLLYGCVLWGRHHLLLQLDIVRGSPGLVNFLVVAAGTASCHTQELAEGLRRTLHAYVQRANS